MSFQRAYTPLPPQRLAPVTITQADWFDLSANDSHQVHRQQTFEDQAVEVEQFGGRNETDVYLELDAEVQRTGGRASESVSWHTNALGGFDEPVDRGPLATLALTWRARNRSSTDHTAAQGTPYQLYTTYTIKPLTILEKLRREIPLNDRDRAVMEEFGLRTRDRLNAPPEEDPVYEPNLEGKTIKRQDAEVSTFDINDTGSGNPVNLVDLNVSPNEVVYLKRLSINGQNYTSSDDLQWTITRSGSEEFYRIPTFGLPDNPFETDLHIPFLNQMTVGVFAANTISNVDARVEYAVVERTLIEKALYGLENEVKADDNLAQRRRSLYDRLRRKLRTGLPLDPEVQKEAQSNEMSAPPTR